MTTTSSRIRGRLATEVTRRAGQSSGREQVRSLFPSAPSRIASFKTGEGILWVSCGGLGEETGGSEIPTGSRQGLSGTYSAVTQHSKRS